MIRFSKRLVARRHRLAIPVRVTHYGRIACLAISFAPLTTPAFGQVVNYYAGKDSAGMAVGIYTVATPQGIQIQDISVAGNRYCKGVLVPGATLGGNSDGTELYPVIDGRATFSELRPDFFIAADIRFLSGGKVQGSALFKQAIYTGPNFPPTDYDASACSTGPLTFSAAYVGSAATPAKAPASKTQADGR